MTAYPQRSAFFAHKFVRLLTKSCAAQDIGLNAFALLCVVAHQEDAARYCGPVRFWNEQLMSTLSLSPKALRTAREKAVEFGWLIYDRDHNRATGNYFVVIPERFKSLTDLPIEEQIGYPIGDAIGAKRVQEGTDSVSDSGHISAPIGYPPSIPAPTPDPVCIDGQKNASPDILIAEHMNRPDVLESVGKWISHLRVNAPHKVPYDNSPQLQAFWDRSVRYGPEGIIEAIEHATAEGWVSLRDPEQYQRKKQNGSNHGKPTSPPSTAEREKAKLQRILSAGSS